MATYRSNIWKMYIFKFLIALHFMGGVLIPYFMDWGGISFTQIMILQSLFVFFIFILEVPTGAVADFMGRKISLIFATIAVAAGAIIYSSIPDFRIFILGELFWALGYALLSGADEALVYDTLIELEEESKSKKIFGRFSSFEFFGYMISAPIGSFIAAEMGLRYTMLFMVIPFTIATILALTFKEPVHHKESDKKRYLDTILSGIKYFKNNKILKILTFDRVSIHAFSFFVIWVYQPILKEMNVPILYFGFIHAVLTGMQVFIMNNFTFFENLVRSKKRYLLISSLISGISFIILGINIYVAGVIILSTLISGFGLTRVVLFQNYLNKHIGSHNRATVISTISMIERSIMAILYPLVGLIVEWSLKYSLIIIGVIIIVCAIVARTEEEHLLD